MTELIAAQQKTAPQGGGKNARSVPVIGEGSELPPAAAAMTAATLIGVGE